MSNEKQLSRIEEPSVALMLQGALSNIQSGQITPQHVDVLEKMMALYERNEKRQSERDFADALVSLQGETARVKATSEVKDSGGTVRYKFAKYEAIMATVQPMLTKHGFSITFDTAVEDGRIVVSCKLTHRSGHSRENKFAVRNSAKPPGSSEAQGDMSNKSYAKRGALCDALNIVIEEDKDGADDARNANCIAPEQAAEIERRVKDSGMVETRVFKWLDITSYEQIRTDQLPEIEKELRKREAKAAAAPSDEPSKEDLF